jgi:hypothetical protein
MRLPAVLERQEAGRETNVNPANGLILVARSGTPRKGSRTGIPRHSGRQQDQVLSGFKRDAIDRGDPVPHIGMRVRYESTTRSRLP